MWYKLILYNPVLWIMILILGGSFLSWFYWYCKNTFELKGSWKYLDKSIHFKKEK